MIGKTISHYKITERLGGGGMGIVYKAEDTKLKRTVALKFLSPEMTRNEDAKNRFIHEAQAASALDHPRIGTIYEIDETEDGQMFISMAYYEGQTLKKKMEQESLDVKEAVDLAIQISHGLATAHERGIVHRDIKPANIIITNEGFVKIVDFGLAKLGGATRITKTGTSMGTPAYMSPEQVKGEEVDHHCDIWSLGVILYELLTNQLPFQGEHEMAILYSIVHEDPVPVTQYNSDIPSELEQIVKKTLEKQTDKRYASMQELLNDLRKYQSSLKAETQDLVETIPQRDVLTQEKGATTEGEIFTGYKPSDDEKKTQVVRPPTKRQIKTLPKTSRQKLALAAVLVLVVSILTITVFMNIRKEHIPEVGYIDLISNPPGALISVNGEPTGQTTPQKIGPLKKGTYEVVLTLEGFESWSKDFSITKNDTLAQTIQLVPTTGTSGNLVVKSDPAEASVYLDLKDTGLKTPVTLQNLSQGLHTVQLKKEGYQTVEQSIDIASEKTEEWSVELTRAVGSLSIDSNPRGASVFLKGKSTGKKTPAVFRNMDVGSYEVQLKKEGYQTFESFVKISAEKTTNISGSLRKAAKKTTGKLTGSLLVDSDPQGALVYLNGKSTGQKTPYLFTGLDAGHYEVRLSLPGFSDNMTEVAVKPNEENKINLGLQEEPRGRLNVTAVILENNTQRTAIANIFVEGQSYGQTPKIISLKGGTYKISAKLFGYTAKSGERQIKIQGGKETTLKFEFVKN